MSLHTKHLQDIEYTLLMAVVKQYYGYDFSGYEQSSFEKQVFRYIDKNRLRTITNLTNEILHTAGAWEDFINAVTIHVSSFFRPPKLFHYLESHIFPKLAQKSSINIWIPGCATGEDVYSLAIILNEANLLSRCNIYATDISPISVKTAEKGIYLKSKLLKSFDAYNSTLGDGRLSKYYVATQKYLLMSRALRKKTSFFSHNIICDGAFKKMDLIICKNVLMYFNKENQAKAINNFYHALSDHGILCLSTHEPIASPSQHDKFEALNTNLNIYRKTNCKSADGNIRYAVQHR